MQDRPTAPELLEAIAEYLYAELRPHVPPEERFRTLVAANLCAVVAREIRAGKAASIEDLQAFAALLGTEGAVAEADDPEPAARAAAAELSAAIRRGELDSRLDGAVARLRDHVRRKLDVARPGYADPVS